MEGFWLHSDRLSCCSQLNPVQKLSEQDGFTAVGAFGTQPKPATHRIALGTAALPEVLAQAARTLIDRLLDEVPAAPQGCGSLQLEQLAVSSPS